MKKLLLLLLFVAGIANAQPPGAITFTDPAFRIKLIAIGGIDSNNDGYITQAEAADPTVTSLDVSNAGITNLTEINYFTSLTTLNCSQNSLMTFDVLYLTSLKTLKCYENNTNGITNLNALTQLEYLDCHQNYFNYLNTDSFPNLAHLDCHDNQITGLSFIYNNLSYLDCYNNALTSINVLYQTNLNFLSCQKNQISVLDVSTLLNLTVLYCSENLLTTLNVNNSPNLYVLSCGVNQLTNLYFSSCLNLQDLTVENNLLSTIDITMLPNLNRLACNNNPLITLTISPTLNPNLTSLSYGDPNFTYYDPSLLTTLTQIACYNQTAVDLHLLTNLQDVFIKDLTAQTSLDLSLLTNMTSFVLLNSSLTYLNIKNGNHVVGTLNYNGALTYTCANDSDVAALITAATAPGYNNNPNLQINSYCSFTPGGPYNTITGVTRFELAPGSGCTGGPEINNVKMSITDTSTTNSGATFTNVAGNYHFDVQQLNLTVAPVFDVPSYFTVTPPSQTITFTSPVNPPQIQVADFCISASNISPDLEVVLLPISQARPGFQANYKLIYKNIGNQMISSGTVTVSYDQTRSTYAGSNPATVPAVPVAGVMSWDYSNMLPLETRVIELTLTLNTPTATPPLNGGDILHYIATINPILGDVHSSDNTMTYNQTVVNSFDPNDKTCLEGDIIDPAKIGEYLHYNINFENTGSASAINIVVKDVIDTTKFDISSLQQIDSSHPVRTKITGNVVEFIFEGINLPPTVTDPTLSHGNVAFKIKTLPTLVIGDQVANTANIYFDYNAPITTNTAASTFNTLSTAGFTFDHSVTVYPNPTRNNVMVKAKTAITSIQIFDLQGRVLQTVIENTDSALLDVSDKRSGVYFLKVNTMQGSSIEKIIKE